MRSLTYLGNLPSLNLDMTASISLDSSASPEKALRCLKWAIKSLIMSLPCFYIDIQIINSKDDRMSMVL
jgi:hypothetical protein